MATSDNDAFEVLGRPLQLAARRARRSGGEPLPVAVVVEAVRGILSRQIVQRDQMNRIAAVVDVGPSPAVKRGDSTDLIEGLRKHSAALRAQDAQRSRR